jgi:hypothetical protein
MGRKGTVLGSDFFMTASPQDFLSRQWKPILFAIWLVTSGVFIVYRWKAIQWFALGDTDDNMRMMQVRDLLAGQDWYDLRQYRLNPPFGADIHWSHLVDLPIAGIILLVKPFFGGVIAEKAAVAIAPLIPLGVAFTGLAITARRLVAPPSYLLAAGIYVSFFLAMGMFMPLRIDHHGWQLATLTIILAGLADPRALRGGLTIGIGTALSLVIGLEMLPWLAIAGAGVGLRWIVDDAQSTRLRGYALALGGGVALGFVIFASEANRIPRCDALTPVWVSVMMLAAAGAFLLSSLKVERWIVRAGLALLLGASVATFFVLAWPDCLGRPEQVSPELERLWLSNVSEAKPLYTRNWPTIMAASASLIGVFGSLWISWRLRTEERGAAWATIALLSLGSALMLLWQTRAAATALTLSVPGAVAVGWTVIPWTRAHKSVFVRVFGTVGAFLVLSGIALQVIGGLIPDKSADSPKMKSVNRANASCLTLPSLRPIAQLPKATVLTFVDLGPRLITVTHHDAVAGPYHRNEQAILDIHHAFRGSADEAQAVARKHGATLLLICPNMSESTLYRVQNPGGFYDQLSKGTVPVWLEPVALPARSPFKLWRIKP